MCKWFTAQTHLWSPEFVIQQISGTTRSFYNYKYVTPSLSLVSSSASNRSNHQRWSAIGFSEKFSKFIRKHLWWSEKFSKCIRKHLPWSTFYLSGRFWFATLMKKVLHWKGELLQILRSFWVGILKNTSRSLQALLFYSNTNYFKNLIPYGFQALTKQHSYKKLHKKKILF